MFDAALARAETLATAPAPIRALAFTGDGAGLLAAIADDPGGALVGLRAATGARVFALTLPIPPAALASRGDGRSFVVTGGVAGDTAGAAVVLSIVGEPNPAAIAACRGPPAGLVLGPDGDRLYATCADDHLVEVDLRLRRRVRLVPLAGAADTSTSPPCHAGAPAAGPGGVLLFVPCRRAGVILKIDRVTLRTVETVDVGVAGVRHLASGPSRTMVALADGTPPLLVPLDRAGRPVGRRVELPWGAARLVPTGATSVWYVSGDGPDGGWLARVDLNRGVVGMAAIPSGPSAIAVWPDAAPPVMWFAKLLGDNNNPGP